MRRPVIAFGPVADRPSWDWVGVDTAQELTKYYDIKLFSGAVPLCDAAVFIKDYPKKLTPRRIVFCPVDRFIEVNHIRMEEGFLRLCNVVLTHSESLVPVLSPFCRRVEYVDHHNRYGLSMLAPFKPDGYIVWMGAHPNVKFLAEWLRKNSLPRQLVIVASGESYVHSIAQGLDYKFVRWSEAAQKEHLIRAAAAMDIKGPIFNQRHKPPTKAQKYVMSGLPVAVNPGNNVYEYFAKRGFELATPDNFERWLSEAYWWETRRFGEKLRRELTLEKIGLRFKSVIDSIL